MGNTSSSSSGDGGKVKRKLHVYENVRWGDLTAGPLSTGVYLSKKNNRKLFELPPDRDVELTESEKRFSGLQMWDLNAFRKDRLRDLVIEMPWIPEKTPHDPYAPDPVTGMRTKKQRYQLEEMKKDRDEFVKEVCDLAKRGGPTDLISACKIATTRTLQSVPDIRAIPELEKVVKTAAKYMNREELFNLIHAIRRNEHVHNRKSLHDDDVEVVELFANGTCAYGHFRGGDLSLIETMSEREIQRQRKAQQVSSSSSWFFSKRGGKRGETKVLSSSITNDGKDKKRSKRLNQVMNNNISNKRSHDDSKSNKELDDSSSSVIGCRIGTGTWRLREEIAQNDIFVRPVIELRFARDHYWSFELTNADMEEGIRVQWRPAKAPRSVLLRSNEQEHHRVYNGMHTTTKRSMLKKDQDIRIVMKPNMMGALREKWIKWPPLRRVKNAQIHEIRELKMLSNEYKKERTKKSGKSSSWLGGVFGIGKDKNGDEDDYDDLNGGVGNKTKTNSVRGDRNSSGNYDSDQKSSKIDNETSENAIELYMACTTGNIEVVKRLVEHSNLSALARFRYGWDGRNNTPVHQAALYGHAHVMEIFMKRVKRGDMVASDMFVRNNNLDTPLHLAVSRLNVICVKHILSAMSRSGRRGAKLSASSDAFTKMSGSINKQGLSPLRIVMQKQAESTESGVISMCTFDLMLEILERE